MNSTAQNTQPISTIAAAWRLEFTSYLKASYPILFVQTPEESRAELEIKNALIDYNEAPNRAMGDRFDLVTWDAVDGMKGVNLDLRLSASDAASLKAPDKVLDALLPDGTVLRDYPNVLCIMRDLDDVIDSIQIRRRLQNIGERQLTVRADCRRPIVIISSRLHIPEKLKQHIAILEFALPGEETIQQRIDYVLRGVPARWVPELTPELREKLARNLPGLTSKEIDNCLARGASLSGGFNQATLVNVKREKASTLKKGEILTYIPDEQIPAIEDIGGYDNLFQWAGRVKKTFTKKARELNIDFPKGIGLLGSPGGAKSTCAKGLGKILDLPVYTMDFGAVFGSKVGESEQRMRDAIRQVEAQNGCVLLIDEVDKMLGGVDSSSGDSGVTRRVFGSLLSWMAEKKSPTFVVMTMNRMESLPPELTRAGRLDKLWFVDLPDEITQRKIFEIHFRKRGVTDNMLALDAVEWRRILSKTRNFSGAEIEAVVNESRYRSFNNRDSAVPTITEIVESAEQVISLYSREKAAMEKFKKDCEGKAEPVYTSPNAAVKKLNAGRIVSE